MYDVGIESVARCLSHFDVLEEGSHTSDPKIKIWIMIRLGSRLVDNIFDISFVARRSKKPIRSSSPTSQANLLRCKSLVHFSDDNTKRLTFI